MAEIASTWSLEHKEGNDAGSEGQSRHCKGREGSEGDNEGRGRQGGVGEDMGRHGRCQLRQGKHGRHRRGSGRVREASGRAWESSGGAREGRDGLEKWQRQISRVRFGRRKERVMKRRRLQISLRFLGLGEEEER